MATGETDVITELSPNEYKTLIYVTKSTLRAIAVDKECIKKRIQEETKTTIKCSKIKTDDTTKRALEIKGTAHKNVYLARQQIKSIGDNDNDNKHGTQPTHFTCVRITDTTIKENFLKFMAESMKSETATEVQRAAFMKLDKLHITFGVMCLADNESYQRAEQLLTECLENVVKPIKSEYDKMEFKASGLEIMKGSPDKTRVLYAKIHSEPLQRIADGITKAFIDAGLGKLEGAKDSVKLHMTVMNVKYVKPKKQHVRSIDATHILREYGDFEFGTQAISQIHLVSMKETDKDGFYKCCATIDV